MGSVIANLFANKELKDRILFTFMMFVIFRLGVHIPVPGVDASVIESLFTSGNLFGFLDLFWGGALSKFSIFAMSITPYINSSIIMQLLTAVIPTLEEWRKDGQEGLEDPEGHKILHDLPRSCTGIRHDLCPAHQQCPCR